jgi:hypothetical protein
MFLFWQETKVNFFFQLMWRVISVAKLDILLVIVPHQNKVCDTIFH